MRTAKRRLLAAVCSAVFVSGSALAQAGGPCPCDFDRSGTINSNDYFAFLGDYLAGLPTADINNNGTVNSEDFFDFLRCYLNPPPACTGPIILGLDPDTAGPDQIVRVDVANLPPNLNPADLCVVGLPPGDGMIHFQAVDTTPDAIFLRTMGQRPGLPPGMFGFEIGEGQFNLIQDVEDFIVPRPVWGWRNIPGNPGVMFNGNFTPVPPAPGPGELIFVGGPRAGDPCVTQCCIDIVFPGFVTVDKEVQILARVWGTGPGCPKFDGHIPCMIPTASLNASAFAARVCNAILSAYAAAGITDIKCNNTPIAGGRRLCLSVFTPEGDVCCIERCDFVVFVSDDLPNCP